MEEAHTWGVLGQIMFHDHAEDRPAPRPQPRGQIWLSIGHNIISCELKVLTEKPFHSVQHIYMAASLVQQAQPAGVGGEEGAGQTCSFVFALQKLIEIDRLTSHDWANVAEQ